VRIIERWLQMDPQTAARSYDLALDSFRRGSLFKPEEIQAAIDIEGIKLEVPLERLYDIAPGQEVSRERRAEAAKRSTAAKEDACAKED
jgi:hypothetical protein